MSDLAIRFGLGAIKAVGFGTMEVVASERKENGDFKDVYDFAKRISPRLVNKKSVEALAKAGAFDRVANNRRQIAESFETLAAYSAHQNEESSSNQIVQFSNDNNKKKISFIRDFLPENEKHLNEYSDLMIAYHPQCRHCSLIVESVKSFAEQVK